MRLWLNLLMVLAIVIGNGSSVAAAICRHKSEVEHVLARQSADARIAAAALSEESAAAVAGKKGAPASSAATAAPADMLTPATISILPRCADPLRLRPGESPRLAGTALRPLLEPPLA